MAITALPTFLGMASGGPAAQVPASLRVGDLLAHAATNPDAALIVPSDDDRRVPYAELLVQAQAIAAGLGRRGVGPGSRVGLLQPNSPELLATFFGIALTGAAAVVMPPPLPFGRTESTTRQLRRIADAAVLAGIVVPAYLRDIATEAGMSPVWTVEELVAEATPFVRVEIAPDAPVIIQFTSGSTSTPRGAVLSHRTVLAQIAAVVEVSGLDGDSVACIWLPLYHDLGLIGSLSFLLARASLVLMRPEEFLARPLSWLEAISRHRVTHAPAPNFAFSLSASRLAREPKPGLDLSSWRVAWNGGEPVDATMLDAAAETLGGYGLARSALWPSYGLAEATCALTTPRPGCEPRVLVVDQAALAAGRVEIVPAGTPGSTRLLSNGSPLPGVRVAVVGPPDRSVGEIWAGGATLMSGYLNAPIETARTLQGRWLVTGDLGFLHEGELYITGRKKDLIIIRGRNLYPQDVEVVVNQLPGVRRGTSVASSRTSSAGEELLVFAETKLTDADELAALASQIEAAVSQETGFRPAVVALLAPAMLPKTSSGKLQRRHTVALFTAGQLETIHTRGAVTPGRQAA